MSLQPQIFEADTSNSSSYILTCAHTGTHSQCGKMLVTIQKADCGHTVYRCLLYCYFNFSVYSKALVRRC